MLFSTPDKIANIKPKNQKILLTNDIFKVIR